METIQIIVLSLIQGLTEFLPISSSAHLILVPLFANWPDQGLAFDVAVHVGTLSAVMFYFRADLRSMTSAWLLSVFKGQHSNDSKLAWAVGFATIPVGLAGLLFKSFIENNLRSALVIAITSIVFGLLLGWSDKTSRFERTEKDITWKDVLFIGCMQALALIPGTSRSGITITAGLMLGLTRQAAARFSFLLAIPIILLSGGLQTLDLMESPLAVDWGQIFLGVLISAISAFVCIHLFLKMLDRIGMMPFVIYRVVLGIVLLLMFY